MFNRAHFTGILYILAAGYLPACAQRRFRSHTARSSKGDKEVCIETAVLHDATGTAAATFPLEIIGNGPLSADRVIGSQWSANWDGGSYDQCGDIDTAVRFTFTEDYKSFGEGSLCIENKCPAAANGCDTNDSTAPSCANQAGYLQFFYDSVFQTGGTGSIVPIKPTDFKYFSIDVYPINCGGTENPTGSKSCGGAFPVSIRFVKNFSSSGGSCGFFDCAFDYKLPLGSAPEGEWTTIKITKETVPWRIRQYKSIGVASCACPLLADTPSASTTERTGISINDALEENEDFDDMILGTGYGEIAGVSMGFEVGGDDSFLHACFDNAIFSSADGTEIFDFEPN